MKIGRSDSDLLFVNRGKRETHSISIGVGHDKSNQILDFEISWVALIWAYLALDL